MSINSSSNLPEDLGITDEMMACPLPRIPFVPPENIPKDLEEELKKHKDKITPGQVGES